MPKFCSLFCLFLVFLIACSSHVCPWQQATAHSELNSLWWHHFIFTLCHSLCRIHWHSDWWKVDGNMACHTDLFHEKDFAFFFTSLSYLTQLWRPCYHHSSLTRSTKTKRRKKTETWSGRKRKSHWEVCILTPPKTNVKSSRWARIRCRPQLYWVWIQFGLSTIPWASRTISWRWPSCISIFRH